jgi:hypothetical protein
MDSSSIQMMERGLKFSFRPRPRRVCPTPWFYGLGGLGVTSAAHETHDEKVMTGFGGAG